MALERQYTTGVGWQTVEVDEVGATLEGFAVHAIQNQVGISNGGDWLPDGVDFASDGMTVTAGSGSFLVGPAAFYLVSAQLLYEITAGGPADSVYCTIPISATLWNVDPIEFELEPAPVALGANVWRGAISVPIPLGPDCTLRMQPTRHNTGGFGGMTANVLENTWLRVVKLSDITE